MTEQTNETSRRSAVGRHLPTSGGLETTLQKAREQGCETAQIFVSNPQGWAEPTPRPDAEAFVEGSRKLGLSPVVVHAKYLINLASKDEYQREKSVAALARELVAAGAIGASFVVVHSGSHGGDGEEKGADRLIRGLDRARDFADDLAGETGRIAEPVVENSCGAGTQLCSDLDSLAFVLERAETKACLDTAHAFVSGHDFSTPEAALEVASEVRQKLDGKVGVIHFNDAKNALGSRRDGHARIGEGQVPLSSWEVFLGEMGGVPLVMETPYAGPEMDAGQVALVKKLAGGLRLEAEGI